MKRSIKKGYFLGGILLAALMLGGCGEEPYELEENERAVIVNYAAHIVAKYNTQQPEGYQYVYIPEEDDTAQEETPEDTSEDDQTTPEGGTGNASSASDTTKSQTTLSQALGLSDIQAVYTGAELTDNYESVVPDSGKQLLILHVTLQNRTDQTQPCDLLSVFPNFRVTVNGSVQATAELSILPENLGTWEDDIAAGASVETVIIFQVSTDVTSVDQLEMQVKTEQNTSVVQFL